MSRKIRKSFTLAELILVVTLIGVIYYLAVIKLPRAFKEDTIKIDNFKEYLLALNDKHKKEVTFVCEDDFETCKVYFGDESYKLDIFNSDTEIYTLDSNGYLQEYSLQSVYVNKKFINEPSLVFRIYKNGFSDEIIIKFDDKYHYFTPFANKANVFDDDVDIENYINDMKSLLEEI